MNILYNIGRRSFRILAFSFPAFLLFSCEKGFLDAKPDKALLVPSSLRDYQALLDNSLDLMNRTPALGEIASDDFFMADRTFDSYPETTQNTYIWAERIYSTPSVPDWDLPYKQVFYANVVLDGLENNKESQARNIKGMALFYRGWALFQAAQLFAAPYNREDAALLPGIPVRTTADVNLPSERGTLRHTYDQILSDIREAIALLEVRQETPTRPSKAAAYALLARFYLVTGDYRKSKEYADSTLALHSDLLDYNDLDPAQEYPMPTLYLTSHRNPEVLFLSNLVATSYLGSSNNTLADTSLYNSYTTHDLRKVLFFTPSRLFQGSYIGIRSFQFSGLAVDEVFLTRAEAHARLGNTEAALKDINTLLIKRFRAGHFKPFHVDEPEALLKFILQERRKELVARGVRWSDLRRLNQEARFAKVLYRNVDGREYTLRPGDLRYTFPIPDGEIQGSGIEQNKR